MTDAAIDVDAGQPEFARPPSLLKRVMADIFNPVLVKEIRQAQRGRVFSIALIVTVSLAMIAALTMAVNVNDQQGARAGVDFFLAVYVFLCGSLVLVVPFQAFVSMGSEWDDNTFEMLVLSNLKPRQIVLGKILAAMVQGLMFFLAFLPFVAVAFLLRGVDFTTLLLVLALTIYACLWLTTVSVMLSTLTRKRFIRVLMMVALAGGLASLIAGGTTMANGLLRWNDSITDPGFWPALLVFLFFATMVGLFAFFTACNLLAHEEENRSSNVRVLITVSVVSLLGLMAFFVHSPTMTLYKEILYAGSIAMIFAVSAFSVFFCCEPERLGRRVEPSVPRSGVLAFLTLPWYPGGGRGVVYLLLHLALITIGAFSITALFDVTPISTLYYSGPLAPGVTTVPAVSASTSLLDEGGLSMLMAVLYALLYTVVPIGFLHGFATTPMKRNVLRAVALFSPVLFALVPAVIGIFFDDVSLQRGRHIGNPERLIGDSWDGRVSEPGYVVLLVPILVAGLLTNLFRMRRAATETQKAAAVNRAKGQAAPGPPSAAEAI